MSETQFNFPTEVIDLSSRGLMYPKENPLSSGKVNMKYMSAREEDILTNENYLNQGIVLDKLMESLITDKIDLKSMWSFDKDSLLIATRILAYGEQYDFVYKNLPQTINLNELEVIEPNEESLKENNFEFTLPHTKTKITFKFLNGYDEELISGDIKGLKKLNLKNNQLVSESSVRWKHIITSVNGDDSPNTINDFVNNHFLARDARELRKYIKSITPGIQTKFTFNNPQTGLEEEANIPIQVNFFWPDVEL